MIKPMGNYTLELGQMVRRNYDLFDFDYPLYDPFHKEEFERKFLLHFRYHEIGQESLQRFKYMLQDTLTVNYEKYLHYYKVKIKADTLPWWDNKNNAIRSERELARTTNSNSTDNAHSEGHSSSFSQDDDISDSTNKFLDTPQGQVTKLDDGYLTTATIDHSKDISTSNSDTTSSSDSSSNSTNNTNGNTKEVYTRTEAGNVGSTTAGTIVSDWLSKAYINVDKMIFDDCEELFMGVY